MNEIESQEENTDHPSQVAIIGGTFDTLHSGHKSYIKQAFIFSKYVHILLRTNGYAQNSKSYIVKSYDIRYSQLENFLREIKKENHCKIHRLEKEEHITKFCIEHQEITLAVIGPEYYPLFERVNQTRERRGIQSLLLLVKQRTKTSDGLDISSTVINGKNHKSIHLKSMPTPNVEIPTATNLFELTPGKPELSVTQL